MIDIRNTIIKELHNYIQKPIIPNSNTQNRPNYPFCDYSIIALVSSGEEGNYSFGDSGEDILSTVELQTKMPMSFNAYSDNEVDAYNLAKNMWNYFKHIGEMPLSLKHITIVDVMDIQNRTILEIDKYEYRYGFDVIVRYKESIERTDLTIQDYSIERKIIKE